MQLISGFQLLQGYKVPPENLMSSFTSMVQPLQMLPYDQKDDAWRVHNMNFGEMKGLEQIRIKHKRLTKDYNLANGIIDKSDYVIEESNENKDLIDILTRESDVPEMTKLQFFPLVPNVIDLLHGEFLKRNNRVMAYAVDETSRNEKLEKKKQLIDQLLSEQARMEIVQKLIEMGADLNSEDAQAQLSDQNIQSLPDVESFMRKSYKNIVEEWAMHQINCDQLRFRMNEMESRGFRDYLSTDEVYFEIMCLENDYMPRILDPRAVFKFKSPSKRYVSESNLAGYVELMTVSDVINTLGYKMTEDEIRSLEQIMPSRNATMLLDLPNDGSYYDVAKSYEDNVRNGSLQFKRTMAFNDAFGPRGASHTLFDFLLDNPETTFGSQNLFRVTTLYWISQKKVGHLTKIDEYGQTTQAIVSEDYIVIDKPEYDTTFYTDKTKDNLTFGEHVDWIWINETWGGIKIGRNSPTTLVQRTTSGPDPIYLGIGNKKRPDRLEFQFKSRSSLYGGAIPIEGIVGTDRSAHSCSLPTRMKPFQIGYNLVNNQALDILIDELGVVIILDQNTLPQHSLGQSWGKNNLAKAYVAMKNFQILPLDTSLANTDSPTHFNNLQKIDASQTERLMGRMQLAEYFKNQAFASIGVTQERMGTVNSQQTATGTQAAVNNSYAQTEKYFTQFSDFLMPRVWELMLSAAQYYTTRENKSVTLSYRNSNDQDIIWQMPDSMDLLPRDIDVYCTTSFERKELKRKLETLAIENNTTGASLYDLGKIMAMDTPSEIMDALKESELKMQKQAEQENQHAMQLQEQMTQLQERTRQMEMQFEASESEKDRQARIVEAEIRSAGYPDTSDSEGDDYLKRLSVIQGQQEYQDTMDFKREQESNRLTSDQDKMNLKREELNTKKQVSDNQLAIARENQTKAEIEKRKKAKESAKKKKSK